jgi:hypothetical protein
MIGVVLCVRQQVLGNCVVARKAQHAPHIDEERARPRLSRASDLSLSRSVPPSLPPSFPPPPSLPTAPSQSLSLPPSPSLPPSLSLPLPLPPSLSLSPPPLSLYLSTFAILRGVKHFSLLLGLGGFLTEVAHLYLLTLGQRPRLHFLALPHHHARQGNLLGFRYACCC